jgi:hypothetical protein
MSSYTYQSGVSTNNVSLDAKFLARQAREERQRKCAKKRLVKQWRSMPKRDREAMIDAARDEKFAFVRDESGVGLAALCTVGAAAAGAGYIAGAYGGVPKVVASVANQTNEIADAVKVTLNSISDAASSAKTVGDSCSSIVSYLHSLVKGIVDACKSLTAGLWKLIFGVCSVAIKATLGLKGMMVKFFDAVVGEVVPDYADEIGSFSSDDIQEQSGITDYLPQIMSVVCVFLMPGMSIKHMVPEFLRRASMFERGSTGIEGVFSTIAQMAQDCINVVLRYFGKEELDLVGVAQKQVMSWVKECTDIFQLIDTDNPKISDLTKANALIMAGYNLRKITSAKHLQVLLDRTLDRLNHRIASHRGLLNADNAFRQQPLFAMFGGASGIGKTNLIKTLAGAVLQLAELCAPEECAQQMWQKGDTEFWNGYCGQLVYIMDDVFQKKQVAGSSENEGFTVIRAVSNWPFPLNFADVESKGRWYFSSKLMIGTTNEANIHSAVAGVLHHPTAVVRRISHGYWLSVREDYALNGALDYVKLNRVYAQRKSDLKKRKLEGEKVTQTDVLACFPWEAFVVKNHTFDKSEETATPYSGTLLDVAKDIAQQLKDREQAHRQIVEDSIDWLEMLADAEKDVVVDQSGCMQACGSRHAEGVVSDCNSVDEAFECNPAPPPLDPLPPPRDMHMDFDDPNFEEFLRQWEVDLEFFEFGAFERVNFEAMKEAYAAYKAEHKWRFRCVAAMKAVFASIPAPILSAIGWAGLAAAAYWAGSIAPHVILRLVLLCVRLINLVGNTVQGLFSAIKEFILGVDTDSLPPAEDQSVHVEHKVMPEKRKKQVVTPSARLQMGNPPADNIADIVYRNCYKMTLDQGSGHEPLGQVLMLCGTYGVMPAHFRQDYAGELKFISCNGSGHVVTVQYSDFLKWRHYVLKECDIMVVDLGGVLVRSHKDIRKHFITDSSFKSLVRIRNTTVRLDAARESKGALERHVMYSSTLRYDPCISTVSGEKENIWAYDCPTKVGDCGSPLTIAEPKYYGGKAILGIHIAGRVNSLMTYNCREGYSAAITRELVDGLLKKIGARVITDKFDEDLADQGVELVVESEPAAEQSGIASGSITYVGTMPNGYTLSQAGSTKLKRTTFRGWGACPVAPAILRPVLRDGILIKPMHQAMANYRTPVRASHVALPDAVMGLAMKQFTKITANAPRHVLTFEEAVQGIPALKLKAINRSTSPGWPWRLSAKDGKKAFFGDGNEVDYSSDACAALKARVDHIVDEAKLGNRLAHITCDFLKDETRPLAKVEAVATRAISGAPLDYTIAVRQYFGLFLSAMFTYHTVSGMAPGINYYSEWSVLQRELARRGQKMFAGDFKAFDASEQPDIHALILGYINDWYDQFEVDPVGRRVREVLWEDLVHSRHLTGDGSVLDTVVQWNKSLPSGHPLTTAVNSMYSLFTLTACYVEATGDYDNMWDHVFICTFGDDNVVSADDDTIEVFNQVSVAKMMKEKFGLTYTSDKKDAELKPYETIHDITFLKRGFARAEVEGGWVAPLAMDSILYRTYFYKSDRTCAEDLAVNFKEALLELSLHPESEWNERYTAAANYCRETGIELSITSYRQARQMCLARTDCWF